MTFDEWCSSKQIKGNWKEALFHHIAEQYPIEQMDGLNRDILAKAWDEVLTHVYRKIAGASETRGNQ